MGHIAMKIYWDDNDDNHDSWSTNASELGLWSVKAWKNMPCKTSDWDIDGEKTWRGNGLVTSNALLNREGEALTDQLRFMEDESHGYQWNNKWLIDDGYLSGPIIPPTSYFWLNY